MPAQAALPSIASCSRLPAACTSPATLFFSFPTFSLFPKIREGLEEKKRKAELFECRYLQLVSRPQSVAYRLDFGTSPTPHSPPHPLPLGHEYLLSVACLRHLRALLTSAYVSIRQHTSAYVSIHQHTSAYVSIRQHTSAYVSIRQHM